MVISSHYMIVHRDGFPLNRPAGADIEPCESDFISVVAGYAMESPLQIVFGEAKTELSFDDHDVRKLGKLAGSIPRELAQSYILFSKTSSFSAEEVALAKTLNTHYSRVVLWSRDELEPFYPYERSKTKLGGHAHAVSLTDLADITHRIYFS